MMSPTVLKRWYMNIDVKSYFWKEKHAIAYFRIEKWISLMSPLLPFWPLCVCLSPECRLTGGPDGIGTPEKKWPHTLSHWWGDKGIQAFPWAKKRTPPRSWFQVWKPSEPGVRGPERGPGPENTHITEGALTGHRHLQGFERMEWKSEEKEKSEMV